VSAKQAQPGDLVFRKTGIWHVAICVKNMGSGGLDVVDSNYVGYGMYPITRGHRDSELIGRHPISVGKINSEGWKTYSGRGRWY